MVLGTLGRRVENRSFHFKDQVEEEKEEGGQPKDPGGNAGEMVSEPVEGITGAKEEHSSGRGREQL